VRASSILKQLKYFQSVVRLNSFSEAAEENFISQLAISQQVQSLERELGFQLLERISPAELKNIPCILVTSEGRRKTEQEYYRDVVGFRGEFLYAENLEEARLMP